MLMENIHVGLSILYSRTVEVKRYNLMLMDNIHMLAFRFCTQEPQRPEDAWILFWIPSLSFKILYPYKSQFLLLYCQQLFTHFLKNIPFNPIQLPYQDFAPFGKHHFPNQSNCSNITTILKHTENQKQYCQKQLIQICSSILAKKKIKKMLLKESTFNRLKTCFELQKNV